ncbi:MAG: zf-HC2 domain-containing protein [Bryobacteraceae bacterium]|nr:zf-HC2 domain-containing protein [Bryobacterales bacterium]MEB2362437.1 zf-HC2 domain-containing protein [Bryobacterales bacterium]NUN02928.1 zf-HC2 domain-containing protein [Bryobacteraceae bacterium]
MSDASCSLIEDTELLAYADGELDARQAADIRRHLADCPECELRLRHLRASLEDFTWRIEEDKRRVSPPRPWQNLKPEFNRVDRELAARLPRAAPRTHRWLAVAATVLVAVIIYQFSRENSVSAAELLDKAAQTGAPTEPGRRIRMKTRQNVFVRPAKLTATTPQHAANDSSFTHIKALFEQARFSWEDPLSARAFAEWRNHLGEKSDEVTVLGSGNQLAERQYRIRTTTPEGALAEASLTLRANDLRPLQETLRFRNNEWVVIAEAEPAGDMPSRQMEPLPPIAASREDISQESVEETPAGADEELHVIAALNRIGADLGEPLEVRREEAERRILVTGIGIDPARQKQILGSVAGIPGVSVHFEDPHPVESPPIESAPAPVAAGPESPLHDLLKEKLGAGRPAGQFVDQVLALSDSALSRAHALYSLSERFPSEIERAFEPHDRSLLASIRLQHHRALLSTAHQLERELDTLLSGAVRERAPPVRCGTWQQCAAGLLRTTQELDETLNLALAGTQPEPTEQLTSKLGETLERWLQAVRASGMSSP